MLNFKYKVMGQTKKKKVLYYKYIYISEINYHLLTHKEQEN